MGALAARRAPADGATFVRDSIACNDGRRIAPIARSLLAFDSRPWLRELRCPALVVAGTDDATTPLRHAQELVAGLPNAELRLIPTGGHWLVKTHSDQLLDIVVPWLAKQGVAA